MKFKANNASYYITAKEFHEPAQIIMSASSPGGVIGFGACFGANKHVYTLGFFGGHGFAPEKLSTCVPVYGCWFKEGFFGWFPQLF